MAVATTKDFTSIREEYAFFFQHATQADRDASAYLPLLHQLPPGPIRFLDFGCGPGGFTARLLRMLALPPERLWLSLVEPVEVYRREALTELQQFTAHPIDAWPALPAAVAGPFRVVLANHVFYYVPDLDTQLKAIISNLAPDGVFLIAIAAQDSTLIQLWNRWYARIGKQVPYHTAEDVEAVLGQLPVRVLKERVDFDLVFPDTEENRLKIVRFLMGHDWSALPRDEALAPFDSYSSGGQIAIRSGQPHFVVRHR
ncbi:MAG: class I SAM-dependent methyltransferase [Gemmataceae bacterium]|nr:class I SAM-dependent methyltransferase [Gemmataceae bacterium]MDW8265341.1 class I SAM-dependent methyltransferase [Gemmataceae bacterium]